MPAPATRLAVDLTGGLIRVVDGALGGPLRCGSGGTPAGSLVDGKVVDVNAVGAALRQLLARTDIMETRALIAASDAVATFRVFSFRRSTTDEDVDAAVAKELPLDPERMSTQWVEVNSDHEERLIYAVAWDRSQVKKVTDAARAAGLDPIAVDLKSACVARTVSEPSCIVLDLSSEPIEIFLIDGYVPRIWHSVRLGIPTGDDAGSALAGPLKSVLRFYTRRRDTEFKSSAPILVSGEHMLSSQAASRLEQVLQHPVAQLPMPPRVSPEVRHAAFLTCLGLIMRRST